MKWNTFTPKPYQMKASTIELCGFVSCVKDTKESECDKQQTNWQSNDLSQIDN